MLTVGSILAFDGLSALCTRTSEPRTPSGGKTRGFHARTQQQGGTFTFTRRSRALALPLLLHTNGVAREGRRDACPLIFWCYTPPTGPGSPLPRRCPSAPCSPLVNPCRPRCFFSDLSSPVLPPPPLLHTPVTRRSIRRVPGHAQAHPPSQGEGSYCSILCLSASLSVAFWPPGARTWLRSDSCFLCHRRSRRCSRLTTAFLCAASMSVAAPAGLPACLPGSPRG